MIGIRDKFDSLFFSDKYLIHIGNSSSSSIVGDDVINTTTLLIFNDDLFVPKFLSVCYQSVTLLNIIIALRLSFLPIISFGPLICGLVLIVGCTILLIGFCPLVLLLDILIPLYSSTNDLDIPYSQIFVLFCHLHLQYLG